MSFLGKLGAAVGIGGAKIKLHAPPELHQAEEVGGQVQILGGKVDQQMGAMTVQLKRYWDETEYYEDSEGRRETRSVTRDEVVVEIQMDGPGQVGPGTDLSSDFTLPIPPDVPLTGAGGTRWRLEASAQVSGAINSGDSMDVVMLPALEVMDIAEAVEKELGWPRSSVEECSDPPGGASITFKVPQDLYKYYDYMVLHIAPRDKFLEVRAVLNLQEKNWKDYFKAMVGADNREERFQLAYSDIYDPQNKPIFGAMVDHLRGMIEKYKN